MIKEFFIISSLLIRFGNIASTVKLFKTRGVCVVCVCVCVCVWLKKVGIHGILCKTGYAYAYVLVLEKGLVAFISSQEGL